MKTIKNLLIIASFLLLTAVTGYSSKPLPKYNNLKSLLDYHTDSVVILNEHDTSNLTFRFNPNGTLSSIKEQKLKGTNWANSSLSLYTYNTNGKLYEIVEQVWVDTAWINTRHYLYSYDNNGNNNIFKVQEWIINAWVNFEMDEMTYDNAGNKISSITKNWDNGGWINVYQVNSTYDANGNLINEIHLNYEGNAWENSIQNSFTYNINNQLLSMTQRFWIDQVWTNSTLFLYTWNANGNCLTWTRQIWSGFSWVNSMQSNYTYNQYGNCTERLNQNFFNNTWEDYTKCTYTYSTGHINGNAYVWDGSWIPTAYSIEIGQYQNGGQSSLYTGWGMQVDYYCNNITTSITNSTSMQSEKISIYPNPFISTATLKLNMSCQNAEICIFDMLGNLMLRKLISGNSLEIKKENLASGMYIVKVSADGMQFSQKIIVE